LKKRGRGRPKGLKDNKPCFRRTKKEIIEGLDLIQAKESWEDYNMSPEQELGIWSQKRQDFLDKKRSLKKIVNDEELSEKDKLRSIIKKEKGINFDELADVLDVSNNHLNSIIKELNKDGYNFNITEGQKVFQSTHPQESGVIFDDSKLFKGRTIRFGIASDNHFGSKKATPKELEAMYDLFQKEGIKVVYHPGDITDGRNVYRGQDRELKYWGQDDQINYVIRKYPKREGIVTKFITGNHDLSLYQKEGAPDPGVAIASKRPDLKYLGQIETNIKLPNDVKMRLIHPEGGGAYALCFDDKTEVLTEKGWKLFKDVGNEKIATVNPNTLGLEYQSPTARQVYNYNDYLLHFKTRTVDLLVTPNHRMWVRRYKKLLGRVKVLLFPQKVRKQISESELYWHFVEAQEIYEYPGKIKQRWQMLKVPNFFNGKIPKMITIPKKKKGKFASQEPHTFGKTDTKLLLSFLGWYISEGSTEKYKTSIAQQKPQRRKEIIELLDKLGWKYSIYSRHIIIWGGELASWLDKECGIGAFNKRVPQFIKELDSSLINIFLETLFAGDGWFKGNKKIGYTSYSPQLINDISELLVKCGYAHSVNKTKISIANKQKYPTINKKPHKIYYRGLVYDFTVPNHTLVVRRNGKVCVSGNSYLAQKYINSLEGGTKPNIIVFGHWHTSLYMDYRNIHSLEAGCFQHQTLYLMRKGIMPARGGWIVEMNISPQGSVSRFCPEFNKFF